MFGILVLTGALFAGSLGQQGADMDDDDFSVYLQKHAEAGEKYGESAAKGCLGGAIGGAPGGFAALCVGCATAAVGNVAQDIVFRNEKVDNALERGRNEKR
jgi:hypothetical protein